LQVVDVIKTYTVLLNSAWFLLLRRARVFFIVSRLFSDVIAWDEYDKNGDFPCFINSYDHWFRNTWLM